MSDQFVGEIRVFGCNFAPKGWAQCNGQILPISQNTALFSLLGTYYGGDGRVTFALPNLQGAATTGTGNGAGLTPYSLGETAGATTTTLTLSQMPAHTHAANAKTGGTSADPNGLIWGSPSGRPAPNFLTDNIGTAQQMNAQALASSGGNGPHNNLMPYQVVNFCIALSGIFPQRP